MLKFINSKINEELDGLAKEFEQSVAKTHELEKELSYTNSCLEIMENKKDAKANTIFSIVCALICGLLSLTGGVAIGFLLVMSAFLITGVCWTTSYFKNARKIKKLYKEYAKTSYKELLTISEELYKKIISEKNRTDQICEKYFTNIDYLSTIENYVKLYAKISNEECSFPLNIPENNLFDKYLNEKVDYSNIHFNNKLDGNLALDKEYIQKPKYYKRTFK